MKSSSSLSNSRTSIESDDLLLIATNDKHSRFVNFLKNRKIIQSKTKLMYNKPLKKIIPTINLNHSNHGHNPQQQRQQYYQPHDLQETSYSDDIHYMPEKYQYPQHHQHHHHHQEQQQQLHQQQSNDHDEYHMDMDYDQCHEPDVIPLTNNPQHIHSTTRKSMILSLSTTIESSESSSTEPSLLSLDPPIDNSSTLSHQQSSSRASLSSSSNIFNPSALSTTSKSTFTTSIATTASIMPSSSSSSSTTTTTTTTSATKIATSQCCMICENLFKFYNRRKRCKKCDSMVCNSCSLNRYI
jgi:hypothetical protein